LKSGDYTKLRIAPVQKWLAATGQRRRGTHIRSAQCPKESADFAPLPKTLADVLNDAYGKETADQIKKTVKDCTAHQLTEAAAYRADLSYVPGK